MQICFARVVCLLSLFLAFHPQVSLAAGTPNFSAGGGSSAKTSSRSVGSFGGNKYFVGIGAIDHNEGVASTNAITGDKTSLAETYSNITLAAIFPTFESWSLSPILMYGYPYKTSYEGDETSLVHVLELRAIHEASLGFDYHFGLGVLYYKQTGLGGTKVLSNGNGTSTFGIPNTASISTLLAWDLGGGYKYDKYRFDLSLLITQIFSSAKRAYNPVFTASMEVF